MRTLWLLIAALLAFAGAIHAQIAAPRLNPALAESPTPFNPATLPWSGASRIGGGLFDEEAEATAPGPPVTAASGDGLMLQARWVGENFAAAVETFSVDLDIIPAFGGGTLEFESNLVGLAFKVGDFISLGIGQQIGEATETQGGVSQSITETLPMAGATLRLGDVFYIGGTFGSETVKFDDGTTSAEEERDVLRAGAGVHWRDGEDGFHLEAYLEDKELVEFRDPTGTVLVFAQLSETVGVTVEAVFSNILLGIEFISTETEELEPFVFPPLKKIEEEETTLIVGWAPEEGLAITLAVLESEETESQGGITGDVTTFDSVFLGAAWLF